MKVFLILFASFFLFTFSNAQASSKPDSLFYRVFLMDSIWTTGSKVKTPLRDSVSYFEIRGGRAEFQFKTATSEKIERGRIIYWKEETAVDGLVNYSFYLSGRGAFKGSLTITIQQKKEDQYEIHVFNAFATYDKCITGRTGTEAAIIRPIKKQYKPGTK